MDSIWSEIPIEIWIFHIKPHLIKICFENQRKRHLNSFLQTKFDKFDIYNKTKENHIDDTFYEFYVNNWKKIGEGRWMRCPPFHFYINF